MGSDELELLQGTLDVLVLKTLSWGPRHGSGVAGGLASGVACGWVGTAASTGPDEGGGGVGV